MDKINELQYLINDKNDELAKRINRIIRLYWKRYIRSNY